MAIFGKKKSGTNNTQAPYNPYAASNTGSSDPSGFANALSPGAAPPPALYQPYQPSAPPASYDASHSAAPYVPGTSTMSTPSAGGPAPKKYIKINGVMKLNPEYKRWKDAQSGGVPSTPAMPQALPVVSNMDDHAQLNSDLGQDVPLAESTNATIEMMQEPEICLEAGMNADEMVDKLGAILAKYEVPLGLSNKLLMLTEFESLDFIIDDSGSMQCTSDTIDPVTKQQNTRWKEAQNRLKEMVEILAYVPFNQIKVEFLNRRTQVVLTRQGRDPQSFLAEANRQIDQVFSQGPSGTTPALEKLQESILRGQGKSIARYFFGDGMPNGGDFAQKEIIKILLHRQNPAGNPITFISCTNEDAQLVAAMNPDDLDAMDESVPFTKATLDNLLGIQHNEESYRHYFDHFCQSQRNRKIEGPSDQIKKNTQWNYQDFLRAPVAKVSYFQQSVVSRSPQQIFRRYSNSSDSSKAIISGAYRSASGRNYFHCR
eukprot:scaffold21700_cov164-Amphora_coffeaeformis.AAC.4